MVRIVARAVAVYDRDRRYCGGDAGEVLDIACVCLPSVLGVACAYTKTDHTSARSHQTKDDDLCHHGRA